MKQRKGKAKEQRKNRGREGWEEMCGVERETESQRQKDREKDLFS